ncbi:MAG TPA: hypothetical protein VLH40_01580 [Atribacteraceae bacterium]|nr:hypothetical protein [Atribacteraceae bacterium]
MNHVDIIPVCAGCNWREVQRLNDSFSLDLEIFMGKTDLRPEWGVWTYPTLFLLDQNLRIVDKWEDAFDLSRLERQIAQINVSPTGRGNKRDNRSPTSPCPEIACY